MPNFAGLITIDPHRSIGSIAVHVTLEEVATDTLQVTEHPVERGADIADHAFKKSTELKISCGWSNANFAALVGAVEGFNTALNRGEAVAPDYISGVYKKLLELQESCIPFDVSTGKRLYSDMLMTSLVQTTDGKSEYTLKVLATFKQIILVDTHLSTLPPRADQALPAVTAETSDAGVKQAVASVPAPGGWQPPNG